MRIDIQRTATTGLLLVLTTVGLTAGCATRKYVRTQVDTSANQISARMDEKDAALQNGIQTNTNQIDELSGVTREHSTQISSLDSGLKATDSKASQAMTVGQGAQSTASQAASHVNTLDNQFQNRNHYKPLSEQSVLFKFGSAKIDKDQFAALEQIATQLKNDPDAILVLEGRTDSVGDPTYNIQLGEKRLEAVTRYLVVEQGVPMQQIYQTSFGADHPVADNKTREGRAQNRAVVIHVMTPDLKTGAANAVVSEASPMTR